MLRMPARLAATLLAVTFICTATAAAQTTGSLQKVPADAAFYASSLRLGEQLDIFLKSNAYARLRDLPAVKFALQMAEKHAHEPGNPLGQAMHFMHDPANRELFELVHDLGRQEIFFYGGDDFNRFIKFVMEINGSMRFDRIIKQIQAQAQGRDANAVQIQALLDAVKNSPNLVVPELVIGFRLTSTTPAKSQIARLEKLLNKVLAQDPRFKDRLSQFKQGDAEGIAFEADGSMIPWDQVPVEQIEEEKGLYKVAIDKLKALKLKVALAVKGDFLLLTFGSSTTALAKFGAGPALSSLAEFAPMVKYADRKIASISYSSLKVAQAIATTPADITEAMKAAQEGLKSTPLSEELRKKIGRDLDEIGKEMSTILPKPAATMGFTFLTPTGMEGFFYHYGDAPEVKPLDTILSHLGGSPLMFLADRGPDLTPAYKNMAKWIKTIYNHALAAAEELAPGPVEMVKTQVDQLLPFLKRFDEITGTMLLPSLADGQSALVIDAKWKSNKWFRDFDQQGKELPMPEIGIVLGLSDAELFLKAARSYRDLANDISKMAHEQAEAIPEQVLPAPQSKKAGPGTIYYWPLPPIGLDEQVLPNFGVSEKFVTFSLSAAHSERLMRPSNSPLKLDQLAPGGRAVTSAGLMDFTRMIAAVRPWVEGILVPAALADIPDDAPPGLRKADIPAQVATVFEVVSTLKRIAVVSYHDGKANVTHRETVIEDLK